MTCQKQHVIWNCHNRNWNKRHDNIKSLGLKSENLWKHVVPIPQHKKKIKFDWNLPQTYGAKSVI